MFKIDLAQTFAICAVFLAGCSANQQVAKNQVPGDLYQYQLIDSQEQKTQTIEQILPSLSQADIIFIGEYHSHSASHLLQAQLFAALYQQRTDLILSMEQFTRDKQSVLDDYLAGKIGEQTLIQQGDAWDNYPSDYRPLVEFAREHKLPVIAANTPLSVVRCVARKGPEYIEQLTEEQRGWVAKDITSSSNEYQQKFAQAMGHHGPGKHKSPVKPGNSFYAQLSRDNTMAESILSALKQAPGSQVLHTNGAFHSNYHLGTVDALKRLAPELKILVISPHFVSEANDWAKGDYIYKIKGLPARYIQKQNRDQAIAKMMQKRKTTGCEL